MITVPKGVPVSRTPWMLSTNADCAVAVNVESVWVSPTVENVVVTEPTLIETGFPEASTAGVNVA